MDRFVTPVKNVLSTSISLLFYIGFFIWNFNNVCPLFSYTNFKSKNPRQTFLQNAPLFSTIVENFLEVTSFFGSF